MNENDMNGTVTKMLEIVTKRMEMIDQIALEDESYNELYMNLRNLNTALRAVIKVQYKIDASEKQSSFMTSLNSLDFKTKEYPDSDFDPAKIAIDPEV